MPGLVYGSLFTERQVVCRGRGHPLFHAAAPVTAEDLRASDRVWHSYPIPQEQTTFAERRVPTHADSIEAATILIMSDGCVGYRPAHHAASLNRALGEAGSSFGFPLHPVTKRSALAKPIGDAFIENLFDVYGLSVDAGHPPPDQARVG